MFQFYKNSILKQSRIRFLMTNIIQQTYQQTKHPQTQDSILNFIRPYETRHNFNTMQSGLMKDISFEVYCFYRTFYNPDLEGFSALSLHQYHILFQLLEHELNLLRPKCKASSWSMSCFLLSRALIWLSFYSRCMGLTWFRSCIQMDTDKLCSKITKICLALAETRFFCTLHPINSITYWSQILLKNG